MTSTVRMVAVMCAMSCVPLLAQKTQMAKDAHPKVDVSVIRPADPASKRQGFDVDGQQIKIFNQSVTSLMMFAYGVHKKQIDGPRELMTQSYDVQGVYDTPGDPNLKQFQEIIQSILEDRFGLKLHHEQRTLPVYAVTRLKSGPKLPESKEDANAQPDQQGNGGPHGMQMHFVNNSMNDFALGMQFFLDRPVVNGTDLRGRYDFVLHWKPGISAVPDATDYPDIFSAVQQELGLKMAPATRPVDVLVVDSVTTPTAN